MNKIDIVLPGAVIAFVTLRYYNKENKECTRQITIESISISDIFIELDKQPIMHEILKEIGKPYSISFTIFSADSFKATKVS